MPILRFIFAVFLIVFFSSNASALSLQEYLSQVKNGNSGYNSTKINSEASNLLSKKAALLTTPNLFIDAKTGFEKQNQAIAFVRYKQLNTENYSVGIEQNFSFGLYSKLYYNANRTEYEGLTSEAPTLTYQTNPVVELTVPLWKDRFGSALRANRDSIYYDNQASKFNYEFATKNFEVEVEKLYWQLAAFQKIVEISKDALNQAIKISQNSNKKMRMNLGEKADVLQANADVESKRLQLKQAINDARIAARNFNQRRYIDSDIVAEKLSEINFDNLTKLPINKNISAVRGDVKAASANVQAVVSKAKIEEENNKPKFDVYGSYGLNGLETTRSESVNNSFKDQGNTGYIGAKFSIPIAIGLQSDIQRGAKASASAAKMDYRQKVSLAQNDWQILLQNLENYQENLQLSMRIENLQKSKLVNERSLLNQGRTSIYQILLFEQDYNLARLNTVRIAYQFLSLIAEKKLYQED